MGDPRVVIVGAGAAGVGAGMALADAGVDFVILEAASRVGGRAFTDTASLPDPWDQGCHWFHSADVNPLVAHADRLGVRYDPREAFGEYGYWQKGRWLDEGGRDAQDAALDAAVAAIYAAGAAGRDVAVSELLDDAGDCTIGQRHILQLMASHDPEDISALCYSEYADTHANWPVIDGYGTLVAKMAEGLPIRLNTPVRALRERPGGVTVVTDAGDIAAGAVIVTVSTNVLAAGVIDITVPQARPVLDALAHVPCGFYEKIAVALKRPIAMEEDLPSFSVEPEGQPPVNWQRPVGRDCQLLGHLGGTPARDLGAAGAQAMADFGLEQLTQVFGADFRNEVQAVVPTDWQANPWVRGAYSEARPGHAADRHAAMNARTGRVAFAGEALSPDAQTTCHGAWASGQAVARRLMAEELRA